MHPTLLPQGRGRAAIPWAILKGLERTGVTMFKLDEGVDTGEIIGQVVIELDQETNATDLYNRVNSAHVELITIHWHDVVLDSLQLTPQDSAQATEWPARKPKDGELFSTMTMKEADRLVRAVTRPYPGAFYQQGGRVVRIWSAKFDPERGDIPLSDGFLIPVDFEVEE